MNHSATWRKSSERVTIAREVLDSPGMQAMLAVLELDHPAKERVISKAINDGRAVNDGFAATLRLGQIDGFNLCLSMLRQLGEASPIVNEAIESTWGVDIKNRETEDKTK